MTITFAALRSLGLRERCGRAVLPGEAFVAHQRAQHRHDAPPPPASAAASEWSETTAASSPMAEPASTAVATATMPATVRNSCRRRPTTPGHGAAPGPGARRSLQMVPAIVPPLLLPSTVSFARLLLPRPTSETDDRFGDGPRAGVVRVAAGPARFPFVRIGVLARTEIGDRCRSYVNGLSLFAGIRRRVCLSGAGREVGGVARDRGGGVLGVDVVVRARVLIGVGGAEEFPDAAGEVAFEAAECFFA